MTAAPGPLALTNRSAMSAGSAPWWSRFPCEQLVDALVRYTQDGGGVSHADPSTRERGGGFAGLFEGATVSVSGLLSGLQGLFDGAPGGLGQHGVGDEVDLALVGLEPQCGGFSHAGEGLVDGLAPSVDPWFLFELDRPVPLVFPLEAGGVGLHVLLLEVAVVGHWVRHFGPRHGSRSRSMERSVPAGMSPVWRAITVWQWPQRQISCDPLWRTGSQPSWRSLRISARAITLSLYQARRISVYDVRHRRSMKAGISDENGKKGREMLDELSVLWWYLSAVVRQSTLVERLTSLDRSEEGSVVEKVILTAIFAALAIAIGAIIVSKVTAKANSINLN